MALDVALDCLLFILLQYMVSCVTLSFWMHPPAARRHFVQFGLYAKFFTTWTSGWASSGPAWC